jgi:dTDP-4-amino-4,6-dideoxygalactose transaminase
MNIPFSPPYIDQKVKQEVLDVMDSGWITTGPKTKELELLISERTGAPASLGINSWTSGMIMFLKWWGLQEGDEVIIPAYTYAATALAVLHAGGVPVIVDVKEDFTIDPKRIEEAITSRTKVIIPVDVGGNLADYEGVHNLINSPKVQQKFIPSHENEAGLGRILVISDAAHSLGAKVDGKESGVLTDVTIFSLHAVKNVTSAEGGIICLNLPEPFKNEELYPGLRRYALNGQTKDAFTKTQGRASWEYDIIERGMKCNLPDLNAALALGQLKQYDKLLKERERVFKRYDSHFINDNRFIVPAFREGIAPSYHIYNLRIKAGKEVRNWIIEQAADKGVSLNVHFKPLPELSYFKNSGDCKINDYSTSLRLFNEELSLPVYPQLTNEQVDYVAETIIDAYNRYKLN